MKFRPLAGASVEPLLAETRTVFAAELAFPYARLAWSYAAPAEAPVVAKLMFALPLIPADIVATIEAELVKLIPLAAFIVPTVLTETRTVLAAELAFAYAKLAVELAVLAVKYAPLAVLLAVFA